MLFGQIEYNEAIDIIVTAIVMGVLIFPEDLLIHFFAGLLADEENESIKSVRKEKMMNCDPGGSNENKWIYI